MPEFISSFDIGAGRSAAHGPTPLLNLGYQVVDSIAVVDDAATLTAVDLLQSLPIPFSVWEPAGVGFGVACPIPMLMGQLIAGADIVAVDVQASQSSTHASVRVNGVAEDNTTRALARVFAAQCRLAPQIDLVIDGDAEAAVRAVGAPGTPGQFSFVCGPPAGALYHSWLNFIEFSDQPPDSFTDGSAQLQELIASIPQGTARYALGVNSSGATVYANDCQFAAIDPSGRLFIEPTDIGNSNEQIPSDVANNSALHYRFHPSVFLRRTAYVRHLRRCLTDLNSIDTVGEWQPLRLTQVNDAPTASKWLISVDGVVQIVELTHPVGSDYRRPRDIWNNVWVPILQSASGYASPTLFAGSGGAFNSGVAVAATRLQYLEYARCIDVTATTSDFPQTNTDPG